MEGKDICLICFHPSKKGVIANKNLCKIYEQLTETKLDHVLGVCSWCYTRLQQAWRMYQLAVQILHDSTDNDKESTEDKQKLISLEQAEELCYSVPKYEALIKKENNSDSEVRATETEPLIKKENNSDSEVRATESEYLIKKENNSDSEERTTEPEPTDLIRIPDPLLTTYSLLTPNPQGPSILRNLLEHSQNDPLLTSKTPIDEHVKHHAKKIGNNILRHCQYCGFSVRGKKKLQKHMKVHTGEKPYECAECGQRFCAHGSLYRHIKIKHKNFKPHVCPTCNMGFGDKSALRTYQHKHSRERRFPCGCGLDFKTAAVPNSHKRRGAHERKKKQKIRCRKCSAVFKSSDVLRQHQRECEFRYECAPCDRIFGSKMSLIQHMKQCHATPKTDFRCHCGMEFKNSLQLSRHKKVHLMFKVGEFRCPVCDEACTSADTLALHARYHPARVSCLTCYTVHVDAADLRIHIRTVHSDVFDS